MTAVAKSSALSMAQTSSITVAVGGSATAGTAMAKIRARNATTNVGDNYSEYRNLCEARMRRLERYKKSRSLCMLDGDGAATESTSSSYAASSTTLGSEETDPDQAYFHSQMEVLKEQMISLMENDLQLFQKLLILGDAVQELKSPQSASPQPTTSMAGKFPLSRRKGLPRTASDTSLSSSYGEEEPEWRPLDEVAGSSRSVSAITRLYVDSDAGTADAEDDIQPNVQYFSRKNSVLRIPIPPRSSNRVLGGSKSIQRRPSHLLRRCHTQPAHSTGASEDSGHSSDGSPPRQRSPVACDGHSTVSSSSSSSSTLSGSTASSSASSARCHHVLYDIQETFNSPSPAVKSSRRSNSSTDSGVESTPSGGSRSSLEHTRTRIWWTIGAHHANGTRSRIPLLLQNKNPQ